MLIAAALIAAATGATLIVTLSVGSSSGSPRAKTSPASQTAARPTARLGPNTTFPPAVQTRFLGGCRPAAGEEVCACALRYFEAHVRLATFVSYGAAVAKGRRSKAPVWEIAAERACVVEPSVLPDPQVAADAAAEELARTAQDAIETLSTEHNGSYLSANGKPSALAAVEATIATSAGNGGAYVSAVSATARSYTVTATSTSGDTFSIERGGTGVLIRFCTPSRIIRGTCVHGSW